MIQFRDGNAWGRANMGWLDSHHTFSFGQYHDPNFMGFEALRVINEDGVSGGAGFPSHSCRRSQSSELVLANRADY